jgi:DNA-binding transcriptional LysR family regulator
VDLMQLSMFVAMVEEGSFRKAALRVSRTQPALSIALRKLEDELGSNLFDKSNRNRYVLTDTGKVLYDYATRMLELRDDAMRAIQNVGSIKNGCLRVGANESTCLYLLPRIILDFRKQYPGIKLDIVRQMSTKLPRELSERNLDFAILSFQPDEKNLETVPIMRDKLVLIASPEHRLAGPHPVHIAELGVESFIAHNVQSPSRKRVIAAFEQHDTRLNITIEISTIETIKKFVKVGLGLSFVPLMCVQEELLRDELAVIGVKEFHYERTLWLVHQKAEVERHAAHAFMRMVKSLGESLDANSLLVGCP